MKNSILIVAAAIGLSGCNSKSSQSAPQAAAIEGSSDAMLALPLNITVSDKATKLAASVQSKLNLVVTIGGSPRAAPADVRGSGVVLGSLEKELPAVSQTLNEQIPYDSTKASATSGSPEVMIQLGPDNTFLDKVPGDAMSCNPVNVPLNNLPKSIAVNCKLISE